MEIHEYLAREGITSSRVLRAIRRVPREEFVPEDQRRLASGDHPLPIGYGQTISQPYVVAYMTEQLDIRPDDRVLEIGTGSGYQAAILAELTRNVFSVERIEKLAVRARETLDRLGYSWVSTECRNGYRGWLEHAPYNRIIVTAAANHIPDPLVTQLADGGRLIIPVGRRDHQNLELIEKRSTKLQQTTLLPVRFVPFIDEGE